MNKFHAFLSLFFLSALAAGAGGTAFAQTQHPSVVGQWEFNRGDLRASLGAPLEFRGTTARGTTFHSMTIAGAPAAVMRFPAALPAEGFLMRHGAQPNGGGAKVNQYTLIMDLMWPGESDGTFRALLNSDPNNTQDAIHFVNPDNAVGINNNYGLEMLPNTWYRLGLVFNLTNNEIVKYLNGSMVSTQRLDESSVALDSRFALEPSALLFSDNDGETAPGFVNSIQFRNEAMDSAALAELGGPSAAGIPGGPPVIEEDVRIESIRREGANIVITVSGGGNLQLQRKVKLSEAAWQNSGSPTTTKVFTVPMAGPTGFFRVQRL